MNPTKAKPGAGRRRASQGVNAWTAANDAQHTAQMASARILAACAIDAARAQLDRYALATDAPDPGMVDAADLIDAARDAMDGAP
jgi:hypothetical protein